jgi:hypothetical protein
MPKLNQPLAVEPLQAAILVMAIGESLVTGGSHAIDALHFQNVKVSSRPKRWSFWRIGMNTEAEIRVKGMQELAAAANQCPQTP